MELLMTAAANLLVGALVGLCGVAGFLLPMFYAGSLGLSVTESLALSFSAFIVSGVLGAWNYHKAGNLDVPFGLRLSLGSILGAILGVKLNLIIPETGVKLLLYSVVLLSGISILLRKEKAEYEKNPEEDGAGSKQNGAAKPERGTGKKPFDIRENLPLTLLLGFLTGAVCALSGAGGPVLVMPLLVVFGTNVRTAVGVALLNSVFIGIPSAVGYLAKCSLEKLFLPLLAAMAAHGVGVYFGSKNAARINQLLLKRGIAVFSILISIWKLSELL